MRKDIEADEKREKEAMFTRKMTELETRVAEKEEERKRKAEEEQRA